MLDEKIITQVEGALRRIFAMKISRSTFRELQNALISVTSGNRELANDLFESLYTGQLKDSLAKQKGVDQLKAILNEFSIPIRLSKEIFERGDFVNIITSDTLGQQDNVAFLNRIKRIDGEEFLFITDPESTIHLLQHFMGRLSELEKKPQGKEQIAMYRKDLAEIRARIDALVENAAPAKTRV